MDDELSQQIKILREATRGPTWRQVGTVVAFIVPLVLVYGYINARSAAHDRAELAGKGCEVDNTQLEFMMDLLNRATTPRVLAPGSPPEAMAQQEADNAEARRFRETTIAKLRARSCSELLKGHLPEPLPVPVPPPPIQTVPEPMKAPLGLTGAQGQQGPQGERGQDGRPGRDGADGQDGQDGQDGAPGPIGPRGPQGLPAPGLFPHPEPVPEPSPSPEPPAQLPIPLPVTPPADCLFGVPGVACVVP